MFMWPVAAAPNGYLLLDGRKVASAQYPGLAAIFGQTAGEVTLPNYQGVFPLGASSGHPLAQRGGAETVALAAAQMPSHYHSGTTPDHVHYTTSPDHLHSVGSLYTGNHSHAVGTSASGLSANVQGQAGGVGVSRYDHTHGGGTDTAGNIGVGGSTGASDRGLGAWSGGANVGLGFNTSGAVVTANGATHENMPPFVAVNFIIRAG